MSLRLGINGWRIHGQRTGVGRYLLNVVRHWTREAVGDRFAEVTIYTARPLDRGETPLPDNVREVVLRSDHPMLVWENLRLGPAARDDVPSVRPIRASRPRATVSPPRTRVRAAPLAVPARGAPLLHPLYGWSARHATRVVGATEASRQDIVRGWGVPLEKIRAVLWPRGRVPAHRRPFRDRPGPRAPRRRRRSLLPLRGQALGAAEPASAPRGLRELKRTGSPHKLLLVASTRELDLGRLPRSWGCRPALSHAGYVPTRARRSLHRAEAFVMPVGVRDGVTARDGGAGLRHARHLHRQLRGCASHRERPARPRLAKHPLVAPWARSPRIPRGAGAWRRGLGERAALFVAALRVRDPWTYSMSRPLPELRRSSSPAAPASSDPTWPRSWSSRLARRGRGRPFFRPRPEPGRRRRTGWRS